MKPFLAGLLLYNLFHSVKLRPMVDAAVDVQNVAQKLKDDPLSSVHNMENVIHNVEEEHHTPGHPNLDITIPVTEDHNTQRPGHELLPFTSTEPEDNVLELSRYRKPEKSPNSVIEKNSGLHLEHLRGPKRVWYRTRMVWRHIWNSIKNFFQRFHRQRFSNVKPKKEIKINTEKILATGIANKIKASASEVKAQIYQDLKLYLSKSQLQENGRVEVESLLQYFDSIEDITKWEASLNKESSNTKELVLRIVESIKEEVKSKSNTGTTLFKLQMMKCLGYFNHHAEDYFLENIFKSLNDTELEKMWRTLISTESEFQALTKRRVNEVGRYNNFLEQLHFEWSAATERNMIVGKAKEIIKTEKVPKEFEDYFQVVAKFENLHLNKNWPVIDKGYYDDTYPIISWSEKFLQKVSKFEGKEPDGKLSEMVSIVYQMLNHIHRFDVQSKKTPNWLFEVIENKFSQRELFIHVLSNEGLSHHNVEELKLLDDFNLKNRLDKGMKTYLVKEWDNEFYRALPAEILKTKGSKEEFPHMWKEEERKQALITDHEEVKKIISRLSSPTHTEEFMSVLASLNDVKIDDVIVKERPDYRISKALAAKAERQDLLESEDARALSQGRKRPSKFGADKNDQSEAQKTLPAEPNEAAKERLSKAVNVILKALDKFAASPGSARAPEEEEATILALGSLVTQNHMAWHLTRSHLKDNKTTWNYLQGYTVIADANESVSKRLRVKFGFVDDMVKEINEYTQRQNLSETFRENVRKAIRNFTPGSQKMDKTPQFLQQYHNFLQSLSKTWYETRWTRVDGGGYDVQIGDLAKESLRLIQRQAFTNMPSKFESQFIQLLVDLDSKDTTGFLTNYLKGAAKDHTDYRAYQYFQKVHWNLMTNSRDSAEDTQTAQTVAFWLS
ncbi:hypothetical protein CROQUDRAFT_134688 [Cronartium quercuum f. sp. fusiforme G11]|uniref:Uncharacterized protein n=1 Tax=Cronartium quercuum f. sp. fusiforme G11 TaxID=708437 RepID=A0A9P6NBZ4_9BASI|nr:hypothetical protein CROQUDRAFT_134688 [Cronartium quercuum f. sp. fusiforme G11]